MAAAWPTLPLEEWRETCDTLHAYTQVLGKLCVALAPPEPQLLHAALRIDGARLGDASAARARRLRRVRRALDLRAHEAVLEHSDGRAGARACSRRPSARSRASCSRRPCAGSPATVEIDPTPQEVPWSEPLDADDRAPHIRAAAGRALLRRGDAGGAGAGRVPRSLPRALDGRERLVGLVRPRRQPVLRRTRRAALAGLHHAQRDGRAGGRRRAGGPATTATGTRRSTPTPTRRRAGLRRRAALAGRRRWDGQLGEYLLDWDDVCASPDPRGAGLDFARSAFAHACAACRWDARLAASAEGHPPPVV